MRFLKNNYLIFFGLLLIVISIILNISALNISFLNPQDYINTSILYKTTFAEAAEYTNGTNLALAEKIQSMLIISGLLYISAAGCFIGSAFVNKKTKND